MNKLLAAGPGLAGYTETELLALLADCAEHVPPEDELAEQLAAILGEVNESTA